MQTSKRVFTAVFCFVLLLALLSIVIIYPWSRSETDYYQDASLRNKLSGTIDYIFIGASHGLVTFMPITADKELNCVSYNLSGSMLPMNSRYFLLNKELERNPIKTVVLELSCDTLSRKASDEYGIGESITISRLDSVSEIIEYLFKYTSYDDWLNVYSRQMSAGVTYWFKRFLGNDVSIVDYDAKGFYGRVSADVSLKDENIVPNYNRYRQEDSINSIEEEKFQRIVDLCKIHGCRVIVVVVPVPDSYIWEKDNLDSFYNYTVDFCRKNEIEFYDFNLVLDRYELYSDKYSFSDEDHMSVTGAEAFMSSYIMIMNQLDSGKDVSDLFYCSYNDLKQDSPYMNYYKSEH